MSTPDPNSSATMTVNPSLTTTSETPATSADIVRTQPSQPPPAPSPPPPPYRAIAPLHHPNQFPQAQNNVYAQPIPNRRPHTPHQLHHQDPSTVLYPFAPPSRGFSTRPVRLSSPLSADPSVAAANQIGYPPRPYNHRQFGPNQMESMMQFMRARNPQIHQLPHPVSGSPVGSGPMRGIPHFLQPRVAPPPTSILDTSRNKNARRRDSALVLVRGRKVRITDGASLYSLGRSWLRNGAHEGIQSQRSDTMKPLPKPLPVDTMEASVPNDAAEEPTDEDKEDEESVKQLSEKDLLKRHIERAKKVRARLREERLRKIARYKARLALLLPQSGEQCMKND
ncbi:lysine-rich arabinogalactan protein 19 isoform X2 [Eutrema salsugineum]|uniref:lysine-rich arabinogalactan protein 19 isoform X2 n=1 Tax=Eutrema salsugineum TaxID=72664 RepID=UPI000CED295B|nr:lysine-rich arabinogalactan protein 19 isoform X2 [Eutrema salsugineum]